MCYGRLYMSKMIPKMISLNFAGLLQHSTRFLLTSPSRHATFISTRWLENDILQTLNDVFGQNLAILRAIWTQIRSSM